MEAYHKTSDLEEFIFFSVDTKNKIILVHPAIYRLDLTKVLCNNKAYM